VEFKKYDIGDCTKIRGLHTETTNNLSSYVSIFAF